MISAKKSRSIDRTAAKLGLLLRQKRYQAMEEDESVFARHTKSYSSSMGLCLVTLSSVFILWFTKIVILDPLFMP